MVILIQYLGYQAQGNIRTYRFRVVDSGGEDREFTLSVPRVSKAELRKYVETHYSAKGKLFKPW